MNPITFFVEGVPKAQPRVKAYRRGNRAGVYDPGTANGWKELVTTTARHYRTEQPLNTALSLSLIFFMPRPAGHFRTVKGKTSFELKPHAPFFVESRPDSDNLCKAVMDALNDINFWRDDSLVCSLSIVKRYANGGAGCRVEIRELVR